MAQNRRESEESFLLRFSMERSQEMMQREEGSWNDETEGLKGSSTHVEKWRNSF